MNVGVPEVVEVLPLTGAVALTDLKAVAFQLAFPFGFSNEPHSLLFSLVWAVYQIRVTFYIFFKNNNLHIIFSQFYYTFVCAGKCLGTSVGKALSK